MKYLISLVLVFFAVGCGQSVREVPEVPPVNGARESQPGIDVDVITTLTFERYLSGHIVHRVVDKEYGVVCYFINGNPINCVKIDQPK